jgi:hypothetical protein
VTNIRLVSEHSCALTRQILDAIRLPPSMDDTLAFSIIFRLAKDAIEAHALAAEQMEKRLRPVERGNQ